jgi:hypothetical protein
MSKYRLYDGDRVSFIYDEYAPLDIYRFNVRISLIKPPVIRDLARIFLADNKNGDVLQEFDLIFDPGCQFAYAEFVVQGYLPIVGVRHQTKLGLKIDKVKVEKI